MRKYLLSGEEIEPIQQLENGSWLVYRVVEIPYGDDFSEIVDENPVIVNAIYDEPPVVKVNHKIVEKNKELNDIKEKIRVLRCEMSEISSDHEKRMAKYKKYDALKHLDLFLEGKITHYVVCNSWRHVGKIISIDDAVTDDVYNGIKSRKLLTLFGKDDKNLEWRLNHYSDGSGGYHTVYPFCSYQEAHDFLQSQFDVLKIDDGAEVLYVKEADEHGFKLPNGYREAAIERAKYYLIKDVEIAEKELQKAKANLSEFE